MNGRQYNENFLITKEHNNILAANKTGVILLNIDINDKLSYRRYIKFKFNKEYEKDILYYFDPSYNLLYIIPKDKSELIIYTINYKTSDQLEFISSVDVFYKGILNSNGDIKFVVGNVEQVNRDLTRLRIVIADSEGFKYARLWINQPLIISSASQNTKDIAELPGKGWVQPAEKVDIPKNFQEIVGNPPEPGKIY